jgi:tryptophanyl-tRNA synthetase
MLSGIKPSGTLTLGNYIGAIKNFINYQDDFDLYVFIANLHAITVKQNPIELKKNTLDIAALYIACGLDPKKCTIFIQTEVLEHANLGFIFECYCYMGELSRMTQYREKTQNTQNESIGVGLFTYPPLMASDILLYDPDYVPVGDDQTQHVELTRDIATRFNNLYGNIFKVPEALKGKVGQRIMSLQNPNKKMSKSSTSFDKECIYLLEDPNKAYKKIMSAVTDSGSQVSYDIANKPGISNLMQIYCSLKNITIIECENEFNGQQYGTFKKAVAQVVKETLETIQSKYQQIINSDELLVILEEGRIKATKLASAKLSQVEKALGLK